MLFRNQRIASDCERAKDGHDEPTSKKHRKERTHKEPCAWFVFAKFFARLARPRGDCVGRNRCGGDWRGKRRDARAIMENRSIKRRGARGESLSGSRGRWRSALGFSVGLSSNALTSGVKCDVRRLLICGLPCHGHADCANRSTACREFGDRCTTTWAAWLGHGHETLCALKATARVATTEASRARRLFADDAHLRRRQWACEPHSMQA